MKNKTDLDGTRVMTIEESLDQYLSGGIRLKDVMVKDLAQIFNSLLSHQRQEILDRLKMNKRKEPETLHSYDPSSGQTFPDIEKAVDRGYNQAVDEFNTKLSTLREKEGKE